MPSINMLRFRELINMLLNEFCIEHLDGRKYFHASTFRKKTMFVWEFRVFICDEIKANWKLSVIPTGLNLLHLQIHHQFFFLQSLFIINKK